MLAEKQEEVKFEPVTVQSISTYDEMERLKKVTDTTNMKAAIRAAITFTISEKERKKI